MQQKTSTKDTLISSICLLAVGIFLIACAGFVANAISWVIGSLLSVVGIVLLLVFFLSHVHKSVSTLVVGAVFSAVGVFFLTDKRHALAVLPIVLGIVLILTSVHLIRGALGLRALGVRNWWISLVFGVVIIVAGGVLVFLPDLSVQFAIVFTGVVMVVNAVLGFITHLVGKKHPQPGQYIEADYHEVPTEEE